jgi:hypothetical protein
MKSGTQIAYIPTHANGDINHPDVEFGFVTSSAGDNCFCRYWRKNHIGEMRTTANSERTPVYLLVKHTSVPQSIVDKWIKELS